MKKLQLAIIFTLFSLLPGLAFSAGDAAEGQKKSAICHACHGANGVATQPIYPNLGGQHQDYMMIALKGFRDKSRPNAIMNGFAATLSDTDIEDITAWYASQSGLIEITDK
jgi:cytochrome c553